MPVRRPCFYWDSCIFIDYVQRNPDWIGILEDIVEESRNKDILIVTSTVTIAEVAFAESERPPGTLDPAKLAALNAMWDDRDIVLTIEFHRGIAEAARDIVRYGRHSGLKLRSIDAIHLATAKNFGVAAFHTTDRDLRKWNDIYFPVHSPITYWMSPMSHGSLPPSMFPREAIDWGVRTSGNPARDVPSSASESADDQPE